MRANYLIYTAVYMYIINKKTIIIQSLVLQIDFIPNKYQ